MMDRLCVATLAVTAALEHRLLNRRSRTLECLADEGAGELDLVAGGDVIEWQGIEALQCGVSIAVNF